MDGYSVTEAASVLGVPTERVWELLARGVLSGAPEGETGMRVFLQPRPAPAAPQPERPNGNGGASEPARELSPFRELLTEFRSLTERYGQALLALGEARGEVAALRSRVDLLEARMDLRLPTSERGGAPPWATPASFPTERQVVPVPPEPEPEPAPAPAAEPTHEAEEEEHRARGKGPRRATQSFAEALARAQDPSIPELPGGPEAAAALAALRASLEHEPVTDEAALPRELPVAEPVLVADEEPSAHDDRAAHEPQAEPPQEPEPAPVEHEAAPAEDAPTPVEPMPSEAEPMSEVATDSETETEPEPETADATAEDEVTLPEEAGASEPVEPALQPTAAEVVAEAPESEVSGETAVPPAEEAAPPDETTEPEPLAWDSQRYTTAIAEPDWLPADEPPSQATVAGEPPAEAEAAADEAPTETEPADAREMPQQPEMVANRDTADRDEETVLWWGRSPEDASGASEMEVAGAHPWTGPAHRSDASPEPPQPHPEDRSESLDEGLAALDAIARPAPEEEPAAQAWPPERPAIQPPVRPEQRTAPPPRPLPRPIGPTPASRAYRRLRRIFPG